MEEDKVRELPHQPSPELVEVLERLLAEARAGHLVGIAWAGIFYGGFYEVDALGTAITDPTHTVGLLRLLEHKALELLIDK